MERAWSVNEKSSSIYRWRSYLIFYLIAPLSIFKRTFFSQYSVILSICLLERYNKHATADISVIYYIHYLGIIYSKFPHIKVNKNIKDFKIVVNSKWSCIEYTFVVTIFKNLKLVGGQGSLVILSISYITFAFWRD